MKAILTNQAFRDKNILTRKLYMWMDSLGLICQPDSSDTLLLKGIKNGKVAFTGPQMVYIDLTNQCNFNCSACWCKSLLIPKNGRRLSDSRISIPFESIQKLVEDLSRLKGTIYIKLSGGGEPLMYPRFLDVITLIKQKLPDAKLDIHTNFSLVDNTMAARLINLGVDKFTASLWAGTPEAFTRTHPHQGADVFYRIVKALEFVARKRADGRPIIEIHDVIMTLNIDDVAAMLNTAIKIRADAIAYTLVDPIPSITEHLLLDNRQRLELLKFFKQLGRSIDRYDQYLDSSTGKSIAICNYDALLKKLSQTDAEAGQYNKYAVQLMPCYIGWAFIRVMADGNVIPCCKGHRMSMGNINHQSFFDIWHGATYHRFRTYALTKSKNHPYFRLMGDGLSDETGCYNCDNVMDNLLIHRKILNHASIYQQLHFEVMRNIKMWMQSIT